MATSKSTAYEANLKAAHAAMRDARAYLNAAEQQAPSADEACSVRDMGGTLYVLTAHMFDFRFSAANDAR